MRIWPILLFVFGPFLVVDNVCGQLVDQGSVTIVARSTGPSCGQYRCIQNATCDGHGHCVCPGFHAGDGRFQCYEHDQSRIQVVSNQFQPINNHNASQAVPLLWPCKYRQTRIQTRGTGNLATCDVQILGMNKLSKGKIILHGVQIFLDLKATNGDRYRLAMRKTGSARMGIYRYNEWSKNIHSHEGIVKRQATGSEIDGSGSGAGGIGIGKRSVPFDDDEDFAGPEPQNELWGQRRPLTFGSERQDLNSHNENTAKFEVDSDSFAVLALKSCGLGVKFRPPSEDGADDDMNGLIITVDKHHAPVRFPDSKTYLHGNLSPITAHEDAKNVVMPVTNAEDAFLSVLKYGAVQDDPSQLGELCVNAINTYHTFCEGVQDTEVKKCHSLLENSKLVKCMGDATHGSSATILHLVTLCLRRVCDYSQHACTLVYTGLKTADCGQHWGSIRKTLNCPDVTRHKRSNG